MPNTDEKRTRTFIMNSHEYEPQTIDPQFENKWKAFLKHGPHYGKPTEIAKEFRNQFKSL